MSIRDAAFSRKDYGQSFELTRFRKYVHMGPFAFATAPRLSSDAHAPFFKNIGMDLAEVNFLGLTPPKA